MYSLFKFLVLCWCSYTSCFYWESWVLHLHFSVSLLLLLQYRDSAPFLCECHLVGLPPETVKKERSRACCFLTCLAMNSICKAAGAVSGLLLSKVICKITNIYEYIYIFKNKQTNKPFHADFMYLVKITSWYFTCIEAVIDKPAWLAGRRNMCWAKWCPGAQASTFCAVFFF